MIRRVAVHVAILKRPYLRQLLSGQKTIESRLTRIGCAPYRQITPGDRIYFKASSGPFMATAIADAVMFRDALTPAAVAAIRREHNHAIRGEPEYWQAKRDSRFATLVVVRDVEPMDVGPSMAPSRGIAWFVFDDEADPMRSITLTAGAIRNRYVRVPAAMRDYFRRNRPAGDQGASDFTLVLPDGEKVRTEVNDRGMIRWRGWGACFEEHTVAAGDAVRFVREAPQRYRVSVHRKPAPRR